MFTIKICGIMRPEDARAAADAGADAIGLNFYAKSPRAVDVDRARTIIAALPPGVVKVGVFVNAPPEDVCRVFDDVGLDLIQLHGDEPPEYSLKLGSRSVMKVFRDAGPDALLTMLGNFVVYRELRCPPRLVLLDAPLQNGFGGSGQLADWSLALAYRGIDSAPPLVLAGGLTPENVAEAIRATGVRAVDTASGVESRPGIKDSLRMAAFARSPCSLRELWNIGKINKD